MNIITNLKHFRSMPVGKVCDVRRRRALSDIGWRRWWWRCRWWWRGRSGRCGETSPCDIDIRSLLMPTWRCEKIENIDDFRILVNWRILPFCFRGYRPLLQNILSITLNWWILHGYIWTAMPSSCKTKLTVNSCTCNVSSKAGYSTGLAGSPACCRKITFI